MDTGIENRSYSFPYLDMRQIGGRYSDVGYLLFVYAENPGEQKAEPTRRNLALSVKIGWHHDHIRPGMANAMPGRFLFYGNHFCETKCSAGKRFRSNFNYEEETR